MLAHVDLHASLVSSSRASYSTWTSPVLCCVQAPVLSRLERLNSRQYVVRLRLPALHARSASLVSTLLSSISSSASGGPGNTSRNRYPTTALRGSAVRLTPSSTSASMPEKPRAALPQSTWCLSQGTSATRR